jgi:two-component system response regulator (stage 0 sporulation protein F)
MPSVYPALSGTYFAQKSDRLHIHVRPILLTAPRIRGGKAIETLKVLGMIHESSYRILLVDDDPNCLDAIDQILRREGYETFPIGEGRAAIEVAAENDIDLAIVDFNLPDMDGIYVLYQLKRIHRNLPVIVMTAEPSNELRLASLEAGAHCFIPKPINIPNLRQIVARVLQSPRTRGLKTMEVRRQIVFTRWIRWIKHR